MTLVFWLFININEPPAECMKGKRAVEAIVRKTGTHFDILGEYTSMNRGRMYALKPLGHESLHHYKWMELSKVLYPNCLYIPLMGMHEIQLCDGCVVDPTTNEVVKSMEYKFRYYKPFSLNGLLDIQEKYHFVHTVDVGHHTFEVNPSKLKYNVSDFSFNLVHTDFSDECFRVLDPVSAEDLRKDMEDIFYRQRSEDRAIQLIGDAIRSGDIRL
jgi:hypothetical protein